ncbi:MAG: ATP:cob(I)alamin adenosyltransferase [Bacillus subtilis]|nr:ATP:cob(I)alamin adenosyltransferase [Bacillus subtilis]
MGERLLQLKPLEPRFVLLGSETTMAGAYVDLARAISRRAERAAIRFADDRKRGDLQLPLVFLNRLSDYLFSRRPIVLMPNDTSSDVFCFSVLKPNAKSRAPAKISLKPFLRCGIITI